MQPLRAEAGRREWATHLTALLLDFGCVQSLIDTCLYKYCGQTKDKIMFVLVYVDDIVCGYSQTRLKDTLVKHLTDALKMDERGHWNGCFA